MSVEQSLVRINIVIEEVEDLYRKFPKLHEVMQTKGAGLWQMSFRKGETFASGIPGVKYEGLYSGYTGGGKIDIAAIKRLKPSLKIDKGTFNITKDFRGLFRHEFGHHIQKVMEENLDKKVLPISAVSGRNLDILKRLMLKTKETN